MFGRILVKPVAVGVPVAKLVESPHTVMLPSAFMAAKLLVAAKILVKPVPAGALVPPERVFPQTVMPPSDLRAANAFVVA